MKTGDVYMSAYGRYVYMQINKQKWLFDEENKRRVDQDKFKPQESR